jgi:hypothetical protein
MRMLTSEERAMLSGKPADCGNKTAPGSSLAVQVAEAMVKCGRGEWKHCAVCERLHWCSTRWGERALRVDAIVAQLGVRA